MEQWLIGLPVWAQVGIFWGLVGAIFGFAVMMDANESANKLYWGFIPWVAGAFIVFAEVIYVLITIGTIWTG